MAVNDKTPMLEPAAANGKDGLATFYTVLGVLFWVGGIAMTVFAVLAFLDIGAFPDIFNTLLGESVTIVTIVFFALGTLFGGLFLVTIGKFIHLLKRLGTLSYQIRGLDAVIPKTIEVAGGKTESKEKSSSRERSSQEESVRSMHQASSRSLENGGVSITFNVQGSLPELAKSLPAVAASSEEGPQEEEA